MFVLLAAVLALPLLYPTAAQAATAAELRRDGSAALKKLYAAVPKAKELADKAKGVLVFPGIVKAGFLVGGLFGEGVLFKDGKAVAYYSTVAASYGYQAGVQKYGYAMILMNDAALQYLDKSDGWELGTGPSIVVWTKAPPAGSRPARPATTSTRSSSAKRASWRAWACRGRRSRRSRSDRDGEDGDLGIGQSANLGSRRPRK